MDSFKSMTLISSLGLNSWSLSIQKLLQSLDYQNNTFLIIYRASRFWLGTSSDFFLHALKILLALLEIERGKMTWSFSIWGRTGHHFLRQFGSETRLELFLKYGIYLRNQRDKRVPLLESQSHRSVHENNTERNYLWFEWCLRDFPAIK